MGRMVFPFLASLVKSIQKYRFIVRVLWFGGGAFIVIMLDLRDGRPTVDWLWPALSFSALAVLIVGIAEVRSRRKNRKSDPRH
jgi:hypothetical protein